MDFGIKGLNAGIGGVRRAVVARLVLSARGVLPLLWGFCAPVFSHYCLQYVLRSERRPTVSPRAHQCLSTHLWESKTVSSAVVDLTLASKSQKPVVDTQSHSLATTTNSAVYAMSEAILLVASAIIRRGAKVAARCNSAIHRSGIAHRVAQIALPLLATSLEITRIARSLPTHCTFLPTHRVCT